MIIYFTVVWIMPGIGRRKKGYWRNRSKVDEPLKHESLHPDAPFMWTRTLEDHHAIYMCTTALPPHSRAVTTHCLVVAEDGT